MGSQLAPFFYAQDALDTTGCIQKRKSQSAQKSIRACPFAD